MLNSTHGAALGNIADGVGMRPVSWRGIGTSLPMTPLALFNMPLLIQVARICDASPEFEAADGTPSGRAPRVASKGGKKALDQVRAVNLREPAANRLGGLGT